jgi:D-amino-acid dehydrogenase
MNKHIAILGGGMIGLSVAAECAQRGHRVTVIERNGAGRDGCSMGNAGMIVPSHFVPLAAPGMVKLGLKWMWNPRSPFYIKPRPSLDLLQWMWHFWHAATPRRVARAAPLLRDLNLASREAYLQFAAAGEAFGVSPTGLLMLCKTQHGLDEEAHAAEVANTLHVPAQVLEAAQAAALDPNITMNIAGAVYFPMDGHLQPERFHAALERRILAAGGTILADTEVTGWRREAGRITAMHTSHGDITADEFVLAGGVWSPLTVRELGLRLPMQAGKGYSLTLPNPIQRPSICAIFTEARIAVTPMGDTLRFGGTMEMAGLDESITTPRVQGIIDAIPGYYPRFRPEHFAGIAPWRGLRPCSPDGLPYIGRTQAAANLLVAAGHAMMGISLAPVTAQIVGRLIDAEPAGFDLDLLSPDRYA